MKNLDEKIQNLKSQQEQAKEIFVKCQGAIELLEALKEEEKEGKDKSSKKEDKKEFFEIKRGKYGEARKRHSQKGYCYS